MSKPQDWDQLSGAAKARLLARLLSYVVDRVCFGEIRITYADLARVPEMGFAPEGDHVVLANGNRQPPKASLYVLVRDDDGACSLHRMDGEPPAASSRTIATFLAPNDDAAHRIAERVTEENRTP